MQHPDRHGLIYGFRNSEGVLENAIELLNTPNLKKALQGRRRRMLSEKIDMNAFMVWFIAHYPASIQHMKDDPSGYYIKSHFSLIGI